MLADKELLGELQFSFICFFLAHGQLITALYTRVTTLIVCITCVVYDAFEHWKELVKLLCFSEQALSTHTDLFTNFISKSILSSLIYLLMCDAKLQQCCIFS